MRRRATLAAGVLVAAAVSGPAVADPVTWRQINPNFTWGPARILHDVEATGPKEAWIAGYQGAVTGTTPSTGTDGTPIPTSQVFQINPKPVLQRWTGGTGWVTQPTPGMTGEGEILSLDSSGPADVWACGRKFTSDFSSAWAAHFDGRTWTDRFVGLSTACDEVRSWGSDVLFRRNVELLRLKADGTWARTTTPPGWTDALKGTLRVRSLDDVYAYTPLTPGRISHWDGSAWTDLPMPAEHSRVVVTDDGVWAFPQATDKVLRFENGAWQVAPRPQYYSSNIDAYEHDGALYVRTVVCYCPMEGPQSPATYPLYRWNGSGWDDVTLPGGAPSGYERGWRLPGGGLLATGKNGFGFTAATTVPAG